MPNTVATDKPATLSSIDEQTSAPFVPLPVKFGEHAVSALVDSRATHNFIAASLFQKLQFLPAFVFAAPCQLQVYLVDEGVVQAGQLATLALTAIDDQGALVPGMPALQLHVLDAPPSEEVLGMPFL